MIENSTKIQRVTFHRYNQTNEQAHFNEEETVEYSQNVGGTAKWKKKHNHIKEDNIKRGKQVEQ